MIDVDAFRAEAARVGAGASPALEAALGGVNAVIGAMREAGLSTLADALDGVQRDASRALVACIDLLGHVARLAGELTTRLRVEVTASVIGLLSHAVAPSTISEPWGFVARTLEAASDAVAAWVVLHSSVAADGVVH